MIVMSLLILAAGCASAQMSATPDVQSNSNDNSVRAAAQKPLNEFDKTEMKVEDGRVVFMGLPDVKNGASAILTNSDGQVIKQVKITPEKNVLKTGSLPSDLYFVTIVYKNKSWKAFTLKV